MKCVFLCVSIAIAAAVVVGEHCHDHNVTSCVLTNCGSAVKVCLHNTCSCENPTVQDAPCSARADCDGGSDCTIHDEHHGHHDPPPPPPHHEHGDEKGEWHCLDAKCKCIKV